MTTQFQLFCNFTEAKRKAASLEEYANRINKSAESIINCNDALSAGWSGEAYDAYIDKSRRLYTDIKSTVNSLRKCAETIRTVAERVYNTEMKALRISQERTFGSN